jgi:hypothetical protein
MLEIKKDIKIMTMYVAIGTTVSWLLVYPIIYFSGNWKWFCQPIGCYIWLSSYVFVWVVGIIAIFISRLNIE